MSDTLRQKLLQQEVIPPPGNWERIARVLDEKAAFRTTREKLLEVSVIPASRNWAAITDKLSEQHISGKLLEAEVLPPAAAWPSIVQQLDQNGSKEKIRRFPYFRAAIAAALLVSSGLAVWQWTKPAANPGTADKTEYRSPVIQEKEDPNPTVTIKELVNPEKSRAVISDEARDEAALEASKKTYARLDLPARKIAGQVSNFYFRQSLPLFTEPETPADAETVKSPAGARYITLLTPDGNMIRLSRKLESLVCCISGAGEDPACNEQLRKWRERITTSSLGHTGDSFMDLLQLIHQESQSEKQ